ncbi:DUF6894 family protein [Microvirga lenta]|uniref:DUF6894 family protein n=1 Tax=Microvirga lenta TaxID=2881337 RepID=UPI001CFD1CA5|nr:hypothetical protein [Microvirga lenta]MCB5173627.1 hypothetical protein [Microvirga lenta]
MKTRLAPLHYNSPDWGAIDPLVEVSSLNALARGYLGMRCYFHLVSSDEQILDDTGIEVSDVEVAQQQALKAIYELRGESDHSPEDWQGWQLMVVDSQGNLILSLPLDVPLQ